MSVVDYLLNSLIKHLQKTQKARKQKRKSKRASLKRPRKLLKPKSLKKKSASGKRKTVFRKSDAGKRPVKKASKKTSGTKKKKAAAVKVKRKSPARRPAARPKVKPVAAKKTKKTSPKVPKDKKAPNEVCVGEITHFFARIQVAVLNMTKGSLSIGDKIHIKGRGTDFLQKVGSLQIESVDVKTASKGQLVGLKVKKGVKVGSKVYKEDK
ncbi:MAG: hypothetical protein KAS66_11585 [Candidatus Omnitrophica bacterium]|nr:hypothetical protein [Candidatus Omnitrophota bacterium]